MKTLLIIFSLFLSLNAFSYDESVDEIISSKCELGEWKSFVFDHTRLNISYSPETETCTMTVSADDYPKYRSYSFNTHGDFSVFISYGEGRPSVDTAMKAYRLLTENNGLRFEYDKKNMYLRVNYDHGMSFLFDTTKGKFLEMSHFDFEEKDDIKKKYRGGLKIWPKQENTLLTIGWKQGSDPRIYPYRKSYFEKRDGSKCIVENKEIYKLYYDGAGIDGAIFLYPTTMSLNKFLKNRCSNFL